MDFVTQLYKPNENRMRQGSLQDHVNDNKKTHIKKLPSAEHKYSLLFINIRSIANTSCTLAGVNVANDEDPAIHRRNLDNRFLRNQTCTMNHNEMLGQFQTVPVNWRRSEMVFTFPALPNSPKMLTSFPLWCLQHPWPWRASWQSQHPCSSGILSIPSLPTCLRQKTSKDLKSIRLSWPHVEPGDDGGIKSHALELTNNQW